MTDTSTVYYGAQVLYHAAQQHPAIAATAVTGLVAGLLLLGWAWGNRANRRQNLEHMQRGLELEQDGDRLLINQGFEILASQPTQETEIVVSGQIRPYEVRVDRLVRSGNKRYAAEIKSGVSAPSLPGNADTRRQLLEYLVTYQTDGALLVDVEHGRVYEIEFPALAAAKRSSSWKFALGFLAGMATGAAMLWFGIK